MASHLKWTIYSAIALAIGNFVASDVVAQQSAWPAYGAPAGRIVIRPRVQHIRWRPAHTVSLYGTAYLPTGVYTVGFGSQPQQPTGDSPTGTGPAGTFENTNNRPQNDPGTCQRNMPGTCDPQPPSDQPQAEPQEDPPQPLDEPAPQPVYDPVQKDTPAQKTPASQKGGPAQKHGPAQKGSPAQKRLTSLDIRLNQLLTKSELLVQELREDRAGNVYLASSQADSH